MPFIIAISQTIFKKFPKQSNQLNRDEKINIEINEKIEYQSLSVEDGHYYVKLKEAISPVGKKGYFFPGHVQVEDSSIIVPSKIVFPFKRGKRWYARVDSGPEFFVGSDVKYLDNRGLMNINDKSAGEYESDNYRDKYGFWSDFIWPISECESNGNFNCLNTYDRAYFTFGFLQYAAHVPNGDFVNLFKNLLNTNLGKSYFPDLKLNGNDIYKETVSGNVRLTSSTSNELLMKYLNPSLVKVNRTEVIQSAKMIHWSIYSKEHRDIQVETGIEHIKSAMKKYARWYPLDGMIDKICLVITDIHHQGRGKKRHVNTALDTGGDQETAYQNLLRIGEGRYKSRIRTLDKSIDKLIEKGILGKRKYKSSKNEFKLN